jgi:hypothetical protein
MKSDNYAQYYKTKLEGALLFQDFVVDILMSQLSFVVALYGSKAYQQSVGESRTGVEIKHDEKFCDTGNLYIEIAEKSRPREGAYTTSGIYRDDNSWLWVIGDYDTLFIFGKRFLQLLHKSERYRTIENNTKTSRGFLLPREDAMKYCLICLEPKKKSVISNLATDLSKAGEELHRLVMQDAKQGTLFNK